MLRRGKKAAEAVCQISYDWELLAKCGFAKMAIKTLNAANVTFHDFS